MNGTGPQIITIEAPPRHGKTELVSKALPTYFLGRWPHKRVILTSYNDSLAKASGRVVMHNFRIYGPTYWGVGLNPNVCSAGEWETTHGGGMISVGMGGALTGRGAHLMVIDDTIKNAKEAISEKVRTGQREWFESTAWSRREPGGVLVLVMTRWHEDDLIGWIQRHCDKKGIPICKLRFPAIAEEGDLLGRAPGEPLWPAQRPLSYLMEQKGLLEDAYWWQSLFQQRPGQYTASEWPDDYFREPFWADWWPHAFDHRVVCLDPSKGRKKGDPSAVVFCGVHGGRLWVEADIAIRPVPAQVDAVIGMARKHAADLVGIEANSFQELLAPIIDRATKDMGIAPLPISLVNNTVRKELRIGRLGPYLSRHHFRFRITPGTQHLVSQLKSFPFGDHDDGPDALEMCVRSINWLAQDAPPPEPDVLFV